MRNNFFNELDQFFAIEFSVPKEDYEAVLRGHTGNEFKFALTQDINMRTFQGTNETCPYRVTFI